MAFIPSDLILPTMVAMDWYCRPSGIMTSAAPGQFTPAYVTFVPLASWMYLPEVTNGPLGHAAADLCGTAVASPAMAAVRLVMIVSFTMFDELISDETESLEATEHDMCWYLYASLPYLANYIAGRILPVMYLTINWFVR